MLGYCKLCDRLVSLRRVDRRPVRVDYYPVHHDGCTGHKVPL
jgi:hypothetical protein